MNIINLSYGKDSMVSIHVAINVLRWSVDGLVKQKWLENASQES